VIDVSTVTEFAKQFPPQLCKTKVASQPNQPTIFILSCPAFWGSNQALQFGFVEPEGQKHDLVLMAVKLNGKPFTDTQLEQFAYRPFKFYAT
jgi:hypothetical protein